MVGVVTKSKLWGPPEKELDDKRVDQAIGQGMKESSGGNEKTGSGKPARTKHAEMKTKGKDERNLGKLTENWWVYVKAFTFFLPYLWPRDVRLQLHFPLLGVCFVAGRVVNC